LGAGRRLSVQVAVPAPVDRSIGEDGPVSVGASRTFWEHGPVSISETEPPATSTAELAPTGINHIQLAALTAVLTGVLAAGGYLGVTATMVAVAVLQAVLIPCWMLGNRLPGRVGGLVLGVLAAAAADGLTLHWPDSGYSPVLGVLGVSIPLMFFHQLSRGVVRTRVVESLAGITLLLVAVVALPGLIVLRHQGSGRTIVLAVLAASGVGLVAAHLTDAVLPAPRFDPDLDRGLPAVVVGVAVGGVVGYLGLRQLIDFAGGRGAFVGAAIGAVACLLSIAASFAESRTIPRTDPSAAEVPGSDGVARADGAGSPAEADASEGDGPAESDRFSRLRPAATAALAIALTVPAAYVLTNALTS
jgi:hypothetical protein